MIVAEGRNSSFSHSFETTAAAEQIWRLWTDVTTWSKWDGGLKTAFLDGPFQVGAVGKIVPHTGANAKFTVTVSMPKISSTFVTSLPLAQLNIERRLQALPNDSGTRFTHKVWFSGPLREVWGFILGRGFRKELPLTMAKLAKIAEG